MRLQQILTLMKGARVVCQSNAPETVRLFGATMDSRKVDSGDVFFALEPKAPRKVDGGLAAPIDNRPENILQALRKGAQAVVFGKRFNIDALAIDEYARSKAIFIEVNSAEAEFANVSAAFSSLKPRFIAAITGTNGKTSTVSLVRDIWRASGVQAYSLGTLGLISDGPHNWLSDGLTTPQADALCKILKEIAGHDADSHLVLEASSQGLNEERLSSVYFDVAAFSNLTRDHLDYHSYNIETQSIEDEAKAQRRYFECKLKLFTERVASGGTAVINVDDPAGREIRSIVSRRRPDLRIWTCSCEGANADFMLQSADYKGESIHLTIAHGLQSENVQLPLAGGYQRYNALLAVPVAMSAGLDFGQAVRGLSHARQIQGRMELVGRAADGGVVYVDYAHTDDAIRSVLSNARHSFPDRHLSILFGCGGNRDGGKRPLMGKVACELADRVYITDDNPRNEDPAVIRLAIRVGCESVINGASFTDDLDRRSTIARAIRELPGNGVLIIAGKGHEDYQEIKGKKMRFSDQDAVKEMIADN